ncbi:hypothetical protein L6452_18189 [Arctium lappa]|uniref:Uncharacterized protein n=1 Tax=Arctium lappa TaxID=4217 RepID=A0ACB9C5F4_ARCLA|nr:hypothetical protein L6452_18189 [Arctium lappa]
MDRLGSRLLQRATSETKEEVAIKKIGNAFDNRIDAERTLREIKLLCHVDHENIVKIKHIIRPPDKEKFNDVYIVYELMDTDLHQIIRSSQLLTDDHCQIFLQNTTDQFQHPVAGSVYLSDFLKLRPDLFQRRSGSGILKRSSLPWRQLSVPIEDFEDYVDNELSLAYDEIQMNFSDIFDVDHFKEALADDVRIISSLPSNHLMLRSVEEKHTPLRVSPQ